MRIFITGTDTDVGKTIACAWLMLHSSARYWKPVLAGLV
jgi:dethiobiotin synthetase